MSYSQFTGNALKYLNAGKVGDPWNHAGQFHGPVASRANRHPIFIVNWGGAFHDQHKPSKDHI
jgi:hypothetical protein